MLFRSEDYRLVPLDDQSVGHTPTDQTRAAGDEDIRHANRFRTPLPRVLGRPDYALRIWITNYAPCHDERDVRRNIALFS